MSAASRLPHDITLCVSAQCPERDDCARFVTPALLDTRPIDDWVGVMDGLLDVPLGHHCPIRVPHVDRGARL